MNFFAYLLLVYICMGMGATLSIDVILRDHEDHLSFHEFIMGIFCWPYILYGHD